MPQSSAGAKKAVETKRAIDPDYFRNLGKIGGKAKNPLKGFGSHPETASIMARKGVEAKRMKKLSNSI